MSMKLENQRWWVMAVAVLAGAETAAALADEGAQLSAPPGAVTRVDRARAIDLPVAPDRAQDSGGSAALRARC